MKFKIGDKIKFTSEIECPMCFGTEATVIDGLRVKITKSPEEGHFEVGQETSDDMNCWDLVIKKETPTYGKLIALMKEKEDAKS